MSPAHDHGGDDDDSDAQPNFEPAPAQQPAAAASQQEDSGQDYDDDDSQAQFVAAPPVSDVPPIPMSPEDREADEAAARRAGQIVENVIKAQQGRAGAFVPLPKPTFQNNQQGGRGGRNRRRRGRDRDQRGDRGNNRGDNRGNFQPGNFQPGGQPHNKGPHQGPHQKPNFSQPQRPGHQGHSGHGGPGNFQPRPPAPVPLPVPPPVVPAFVPPPLVIPQVVDEPAFVAALPIAPIVHAPVVHEPEPGPVNYAEAMDDASADIYDESPAETSAPEAAAAAADAPQGENTAAAPSDATQKSQPHATGQRQRTGKNWRESTYESSSVVPQPAPTNVRKVVLLNSTEPGEIRVAILENGELAEIFMERKSHYQQAGNIYKGRVVNVEPSLQAAFIDLGAERNGFLHASDVIPPTGGYDDVLDKRGRGQQGNQQPNQPQQGQQPHQGKRDFNRDRRDFREKGATPPSVLAAQQGQAATAGFTPQGGAQGPLLLNRPARPAQNQPSAPRFADQRPPPPQQQPRQEQPSEQDLSAPLALSSPALPSAPEEAAPPAAPVAVGTPVSAGVSADVLGQPHEAAPEHEPMPIVPGQPYHGQAHAPAPVYGQQAQGGPRNNDSRRRRRRGGRGRQNRARFPGPAPMIAPQPGPDDLQGSLDFPPPAGGAEFQPSSGGADFQPEASVAHEYSTQHSGSEVHDTSDITSPAPAAPEITSIGAPVGDLIPMLDTFDVPQTSIQASTGETPEQSAPQADLLQQPSDEVRSAPPVETAPAPSIDTPSQRSTEQPEASENPSSRLDAAAELADQVEEVVQPPGASGVHMAEDSNLADTREHNAVEDRAAGAVLDSDKPATASIAEIVTREHEPVLPVTGQQPQTFALPPGQQPRKPFRTNKDRAYDRRYTIQEMLREGQEVLVQVAKEGIGQKGPALTTYISLPGRYLVLMPAVSRLGVSKRIDSEEQRRALKDALAQLNCPDEMGVIVRTAGMGRSKDELQRDMEYLMRAWEGLKEKTRGTRSPSLIYQEGDVVTRVFRDVLTEDVTEIIIDDPVVMQRATEFLKETSPGSEKKLKLYSESEPLFHRYNVEQQMQRLFNRKVNLKNGGSIVIEQTEALVAIDVNTGRYREKRNQDDTILQTNLEAAREIARQLRLRDIGGLVMIDFIDMEYHEHRRRVERELKTHLARDKAKINVLPVSSLGVVEMTRQRIRHSLKKTLFDRCPHCQGVGHVKSPESIGLEMLREIKSQVRDKTVRRVKVQLNPSAAYAILNQFRKDMVRMEEASGITIEVLGDPSVAISQMQVSTAKEGGDWTLKKVSEVDDYVRNS